MNQNERERLERLWTVADGAGALDSAKPDIRRRLEQYFADKDLADWEIQAFMRTLRRDAAHLWPRRADAGAPAQAETPAPSVDWAKITNPMQRLTAWRAAEASKQK